MSGTLAIKFRALGTAAFRKDAECAAFLNWLACWVVLPNLPFLPITLMGGPPRFYDILLCGIVGLVARRLNYWTRLAAFIALMTYLVLSFIASMFNMAITMIMSVIGLVLDMSPAVSTEYVTGAILLILTCGLAIWLLRQRSAFTQPKWLFSAVGIVLALSAADYGISKDAIGSYSRIAPAGAPFSSATQKTGLLRLADGKTNVMVIVVEAMGQPNDPRLRAQLEHLWDRPELAGRFDIVHGETTFFGSTTSGEVRELCQRWGNYAEITAPDPRCLPAKLARRGYQTTSFHAFYSDFFERDRWYPLIGFQHMIFGGDLMKRGASYCPNVFPGACDKDVPDIIGARLTSAAKPQFIYWLTLNSHLPIVENRELGTENCHRLGRELDTDFPMICRLFSIWESTADALVKVVDRPNFPPTHILIVGDHMPPFTHQKSRMQFDPEHVPWVLLRYKGAEMPAVQSRE
jgi:hypothetical protein